MCLKDLGRALDTPFVARSWASRPSACLLWAPVGRLPLRRLSVGASLLDTCQAESPKSLRILGSPGYPNASAVGSGAGGSGWVPSKGLAVLPFLLGEGAGVFWVTFPPGPPLQCHSYGTVPLRCSGQISLTPSRRGTETSLHLTFYK